MADEEKTRALMIDLAKVATVAGQRLEALSGLSEDVQSLREQVESLDRTIKQTFVTKDHLAEEYPDYKDLDARIATVERNAEHAVDNARRKVNRRTVVIVLLAVIAGGGFMWRSDRASVQADYDTCVRGNESRADLRDTFVTQSENLIKGVAPPDGPPPSARAQAFIDALRADTLKSVEKFKPRDCNALYPSAPHKETP
jgi:hypothetical protein